MTKIILASTSPRRKLLLEQTSLNFSVGQADIDESIKPNEQAKDYVIRMAYEKSVSAQKIYGQDDIIITADTIGVVFDKKNREKILIKPTDYEDAVCMWQLMSDNTHQVMTAVSVAYQQHRLQKIVTTNVSFINLTAEMMHKYWETKEPADKAGAYAIQGLGRSWVKSIEGSYDNVVGLPVTETLILIKNIQKI